MKATLAVFLSAVASQIVPKVEFNFEVLLYITILVYLSPGSCSRSAIRYQNSISKHTHRSHVIRGCRRKEKFFTRKVWEDSALLKIPFGHLNIDLCFSYLVKSQRSNFSILSFIGKIWPTIQRAVITIVFLTLWLAGHIGCVWGRKSINNGVITGGYFWPRASRARSCIALAPLIRLFCRLRRMNFKFMCPSAYWQ